MYLELCVCELKCSGQVRVVRLTAAVAALQQSAPGGAGRPGKFLARNIFTDSSLRGPLWLQVVSGTSGSGSEPSLPRGLLSVASRLLCSGDPTARTAVDTRTQHHPLAQQVRRHSRSHCGPTAPAAPEAPQKEAIFRVTRSLTIDWMTLMP